MVDFRRSPSGPLAPIVSTIPNLDQVLGEGNSAGGQVISDLGAGAALSDAARLADLLAIDLSVVLGNGPSASNQRIQDLGAPVNPNDGARLADVLAIISSLVVGRITVGPAVAVSGTMPITPLSGFGVAADRVQLGGPGIFIAMWSCNVQVTGNSSYTFQSTSQSPLVVNDLPTVNFPFKQDAIWSGLDANEELWIDYTAANIPTITNGVMTILKIPL